MNGPALLRLRARRAFTLVELLVVIGIIAVLIGVLLPVLSGVASRGRDLKCQANLRTIGQLVMTYAAENKGSLPYGVIYLQSDPVTWGNAGPDEKLSTVWSVISRLSGKQYTGEDVFLQPGSTSNPEARKSTAPFLRCPEAEQQGSHICSYAAQFVAFCSPLYEYAAAGGRPFQTKPARTTELYPFTALAWDTAIHLPGMAEDVGYVTGADIDGQRLWTNITQRRHYSVRDPFGLIPPGTFGQSRPVQMNVATNVWKNIDPPPISQGFNTYPFQGNLRWRHNKETSVNVLYADGRVESNQAKFNGDKTMKSHTMLRKSFQTKWPSGQGLQPHPSHPN